CPSGRCSNAIASLLEHFRDGTRTRRWASRSLCASAGTSTAVEPSLTSSTGARRSAGDELARRYQGTSRRRSVPDDAARRVAGARREHQEARVLHPNYLIQRAEAFAPGPTRWAKPAGGDGGCGNPASRQKHWYRQKPPSRDLLSVR